MSPNISMDRVFLSEGKDRSSILLLGAILVIKRCLNTSFLFFKIKYKKFAKSE